ncbi:iron-containing redox enzyme family protein [Halopseudomonas pelagia]|nr:iron-containing redox enzyme family protein [Halopseudomonas pelagia]
MAGIFSTTKNLYDQLISEPQAEKTAAASRLFLQEHLSVAAEMDCELPEDVRALEAWIANKAASVGKQYAAYLEERNAGKPRRFFTSKAHALHFLQAVAPTKLVDGAWLYGTLEHWQDPRFHPLIRTYLEELGDGVAQMNHVLMYRQLLARHGCEAPLALPDEYYVQGTLQLSLAYHAQEFLPEVIGYNLGYEQLPLHLLISAFELHELNIDPYYFTLHITIDNAHSGHAHQAVQALLQQCAGGTDPDFYQRVRAGYQLNDVGVGSGTIIRSFDLHEELLRMLDQKRTFGQQMHSDFCKLEGKTVNEWLSEPGQMLAFLDALEARGWIQRGVDPGQSRFWHLIAGPDALMFGVFTEYEQRLIYEWIADGWLMQEEAKSSARQRQFKPARGSRRKAESDTAVCPADRTQLALEPLSEPLETLRQQLESMPRIERMATLINMMNPSLHGTPEGLLATRLFSSQMY